jgi:hypothetical protein
MGADCCGGDSLPAAVHDIHLSEPLSNGKKEEPSAKTHEESAKELEGFIKKRIELFEQYAAREAEAVRRLPSCARQPVITCPLCCRMITGSRTSI